MDLLLLSDLHNGLNHIDHDSQQEPFSGHQCRLRHANRTANQFDRSIRSIFAEAVQGKRNLWVSSILFAELRPSSFIQGEFNSIDDLAMYIRSIATVVTPDPDMSLRAARLRDFKWLRPNRMKEERPRCMSLGDALHIVAALWVKEFQKISDLEFLTFDDGKSNSMELDEGMKSLSLLQLEKYTDRISHDVDVQAAMKLNRRLPMLSQESLL